MKIVIADCRKIKKKIAVCFANYPYSRLILSHAVTLIHIRDNQHSTYREHHIEYDICVCDDISYLQLLTMLRVSSYCSAFLSLLRIISLVNIRRIRVRNIGVTRSLANRKNFNNSNNSLMTKQEESPKCLPFLYKTLQGHNMFLLAPIFFSAFRHVVGHSHNVHIDL